VLRGRIASELTVKPKKGGFVPTKLLAAAAAAAALFGLVSTALAGAPARGPTGKNFLVLQFKVSPPRAGVGVGAEFDSFGGNDVDGQLPATNDQTRIIDVRLARGSRVNNSAVASCTLADANRNRCSRASQVGTGTATADARPTIATPVPARVTAFNGKTSAGRPAVLLRAVANLNGNQVPLVLVAAIRPAAAGFGPSFVVDNGPLTPGQTPLFGIRQLHLNLPDKVVRVRGRLVHFLVAPPTCRGSWLYEQVNTSYAGAKLIATDRVPCVR
jgi:hypothetical protein